MWPFLRHRLGNCVVGSTCFVATTEHFSFRSTVCNNKFTSLSTHLRIHSSRLPKPTKRNANAVNSVNDEWSFRSAGVGPFFTSFLCTHTQTMARRIARSMSPNCELSKCWCERWNGRRLRKTSTEVSQRSQTVPFGRVYIKHFGVGVLNQVAKRKEKLNFILFEIDRKTKQIVQWNKTKLIKCKRLEDGKKRRGNHISSKLKIISSEKSRIETKRGAQRINDDSCVLKWNDELNWNFNFLCDLKRQQQQRGRERRFPSKD